jgi:2,3-dihydroxy-p-cumate/2,3-dihydroxybenzoate 3,4-dioxygenase
MEVVMVRYAKLGYVALNVTDLSRSEAFYGPEIVGLQSVGGDGDERFLRCSDDHHNVILCKGREPGLKRVAWEVETDEQLERMRARLHDAGVQIHDVPADECARLHQGPTFRISQQHTGATYEYYSMMGNYGGLPFQPTVANIARLGHVILKAPEFEAATKFHEEVLNFKVSDIIGDFVRFYRCWPNPYHHTFGLQRSPTQGFSHINFMVSDIDDIGRAIGRFHKQQVRIAWGPGRHPPSGSIFLYFLDPDGMTAEYSFGMEEFPEVGARKPRLLEPLPENIDYWDAPRYAPTADVGNVEPMHP